MTSENGHPPPVSGTVLVASTGGHLSELHQLAHRMSLERPFHWVTFQTPQSTALLHGQPVAWAAYTGQRDLKGVARNLPLAHRVLDRGTVSAVVSTGAAIALAFLPLARARGIDAHYVEGIARAEGPSMTGRLLGRIPGIKLYTQWPQWEDETWRYRGSVFDRFEAQKARTTRVTIRRVAVLLGTMPYSFRRLVEQLVRILPSDAEVTWQVGETPTDDLGIVAHRTLPPDELRRALVQADVVVGHAGGGSALQVMEAGKCPVLVPREAAHREHVDDHQLQIAKMLPALGLAVAARAQELSLSHLEEAAQRSILTVPEPPAFQLG
ncbi:MAG: hypothetical protein JO156_05520 [Solirubrobacterales bacterium]|nr:hypothetical protein [Solirubrobacterales bacterium]